MILKRSCCRLCGVSSSATSNAIMTTTTTTKTTTTMTTTTGKTTTAMIIAFMLLLWIPAVQSLNTTNTTNATTSPTGSNNNNTFIRINQTLVQVLQSTSTNHDFFLKLLNTTKIGDIVNSSNSSNGSFTLFAPTDDSFANLDTPYTYYVGDNWIVHAVTTVGYHVVTTKLNETQIFSLNTSSLPTLAVNNSMPVDPTTKTIANNASIVKADIAASNGYLQIPDRVLIPNLLINTTVETLFFNQLATTFTYFNRIFEAAEAYSLAHNGSSLRSLLSNNTNEYGTTLLIATDDAFTNSSFNDALPQFFDATLPLAYLMVTYHMAGLNVNPIPVPDYAYIYYAYNDVSIWYSANSPNKTNVQVNAANIIKTYIAGNGVINVIDRPLFPLYIKEQLQIATYLQAANLSGFVQLVTDFDPTFWPSTNAETLTLFAPTDEGLQALAALGLLTRWQQPTWSQHYGNVLLHHFVTGYLNGGEVIAYEEVGDLTMNSGYNTTVQGSNGNLLINNITCIFTDVTGLNGIINGIPQVLLPPWVNYTLYNEISNITLFDTLAKLIDMTNLTDTLNNANSGPWTLLAPDDTAFEELDISSYSENDIYTLLLGHLFEGNVYFNQIAAATSVVADKWTVTTSNGDVFVQGALISGPDNFASNGVFHVIDKLLLPAGTPTLAPRPTTAGGGGGGGGTAPTVAPGKSPTNSSTTSSAVWWGSKKQNVGGVVALFMTTWLVFSMMV